MSIKIQSVRNSREGAQCRVKLPGIDGGSHYSRTSGDSQEASFKTNYSCPETLRLAQIGQSLKSFPHPSIYVCRCSLDNICLCFGGQAQMGTHLSWGPTVPPNLNLSFHISSSFLLYVLADFSLSPNPTILQVSKWFKFSTPDPRRDENHAGEEVQSMNVREQKEWMYSSSF